MKDIVVHFDHILRDEKENDVAGFLYRNFNHELGMAYIDPLSETPVQSTIGDFLMLNGLMNGLHRAEERFLDAIFGRPIPMSPNGLRLERDWLYNNLMAG